MLNLHQRGVAALAALVLSWPVGALADGVDTLRSFVRDVKSGRASFSQTVVSPDGARRKASSGTFEFARPDRFRFEYTKPYRQLIVADGQKVWIHDPDLNQASSRRLAQALGATPAALLAGGSLDRDFALTALPSKDGVEWVQAVPRARDGAFQSMRVGFRGPALAAVEVLDNLGQRSLLQFDGFAANVALPPETFRFVPPPGADVIEQ
jgi:outer membrane lipoprotein carrier protein